MLVTGKVRNWPKGGNYDNIFVQIHLTITEQDEETMLLFNGYMWPNEIKRLNELLTTYWGNEVFLINMRANDNRTHAKEYMVGWGKRKGITVFKNAIMFLTQLQLVIGTKTISLESEVKLNNKKETEQTSLFNQEI